MSIQFYNPATLASDYFFSKNNYHHAVLSISGNIHTLFLDGSMVSQIINAGNIFATYSNFNKLFIGCRGSDLSYGFTGRIDDFRIYNRTLLQADVSNLFLYSYNPFSAELYFKFDKDFKNYGTRIAVTDATKSGSSPVIGTRAGKSCLTITTNNDYVYFPAFGDSSTTAIPNRFSFCFWIDISGNGTSNEIETMSIADRLFSTTSSMFQGDTSITNTTNVMFGAFIGNNPGWTNLFTSSISNAVNNWYHVTFVMNKTGNCSIYLNGLLKATTSSTPSYQSLSDYYIILGRPGDTATNRPFQNSGMREFMYFSRALTAKEIMQIYTITA